MSLFGKTGDPPASQNTNEQAKELLATVTTDLMHYAKQLTPTTEETYDPALATLVCHLLNAIITIRRVMATL